MKIEESIRQAQTYLAQGNVTGAIAICQQVIEQQPDAIAAYMILGEALEAQGEPTGARDAYTKVLELDPQFALAHAYLGQLYAEYWWLDEAAYHYQQALILKPDWSEVHYNLGNVFQKQGNLPGAVGSYRAAIALRPNYADAYYNLGLVFDQQNELAAAVESYAQVIAIAPKYVKAYSNLGCTLVKQGKFEEAIATYQQGIAVKPDWATLHNNLGQVLLEKQPEDAIAAYRRALELEPDMELAHYNLGKAWQMQSRHEQAVSCFQRVIELNPNYISAYTDCGFSLMALGKFASAIPYFHQAIDLKPEFVEAYCELVEASAIASSQEQDQLQQANAACYLFLRALIGPKEEGRRKKEEGRRKKEEGRRKKEEGRGKGKEIISEIKLEEKSQLPITNYQLPITNYQLPIREICQYLAQTYLHLGNALFEYGGYEQAEIYYQKALQIQPNNAEIYWQLGKSLAKQERLNAAIVVYHLALAIQPELTQVYFELGNLLEKQQHYESAIGYYEKVLTLPSLGRLRTGDFPPSNSPIHKLPQGIYLSTSDWIIASKLDRSNYREIICEDVENIATHQLSITNNQLPKSDCGGLTCGPCLKRISDWFEPIHLGWGVHVLSNSQPIPVDSPKTFVAVVPDGRAWIVPQKSYWLLCSAIAVITPDNYLLADLSRDYPNFLPGCQNHDPTKHSIFKLESLPPLEQIDGTVAVLSGLSGNVYFHWMLDVLPRIELLRLSGTDFDKIDWFLVNNCQQQFQRETLKALGIPENKILESDCHPHIQAKQLIVPSFPGYLGWPPLWAVNFLRRVFLAGITPLSSYPDRIYISRNKARYRRVFNEEDVMEELSKFGFVRIFLESMPLQEQIALFFHAKMIVTPHGSGLTNTIFCQAGTKVIELVSPHYVGHYYWPSSHYLHLDHYYLTGEVFECYPIRQLMYQNSLTEDIMVNLSSLKKMMEIIGL
jgi:tetratricopeptide (TPR) repeat protein/capsular polysaccharide biosynthesis protein